MDGLERFDYALPGELIAQAPAPGRSDSRLMVLGADGCTAHDRFFNLGRYVERGDVLVLNDTRVVPARLEGRRSTGGKVELLVFETSPDGTARALLKGTARIGERLEFDGLGGVVREKAGGIALVDFERGAVNALCEKGRMPLPPYIRKRLDEQERYQTVYASEEGSVAAPTAGLHFTPELLDGLSAKGVELAKVTLHIGPGTFMPVARGLNLPERYLVGEEAALTINSAVQDGRRVLVVGTSTYKCLESACEDGLVKAGEGKSSLFISPPHEFRFGASALLTNFHLPRSSVLLLTCAYAGRERVLRAYEEAVAMSYRFYSFGDSMLIFGGGGDGAVQADDKE